MRFKKILSSALALAVMTASLSSVVMNANASDLQPSESREVIELSADIEGLTDLYLKNVPLSDILDKLVYAQDVYELVDEKPEESEPDVSEPDVSEPETSEPETSEPETSEPEMSEPETSEPEASEPEASEPEASEPEASEPEASEPEASEPEASEPETSEPETSEPEASEPEASEPETSEPETSEPETSEPETSEPEMSEPETSEPEASEPEASELETGGDKPDFIVTGSEEFSDDEDEDIGIDIDEDERIPVLVHKKGDKFELPEDAEYIWIDEERFTLSESSGLTLDLFDEEAVGSYFLEKDVVIGKGQADSDGNREFSLTLRVTKSSWLFSCFEFYTVSVTDEKTALETTPAEIGKDYAVFETPELPEAGKNIYLNAMAPEGVTLEVSYKGEAVKANYILVDGSILIDFSMTDEDGNVLREETDFKVSLVQAEKPEENEPAESEPSENEPSESEPSESEPSESEPSESEPSESEPAIPEPEPEPALPEPEPEPTVPEPEPEPAVPEPEPEPAIPEPEPEPAIPEPEPEPAPAVKPELFIESGDITVYFDDISGKFRNIYAAYKGNVDSADVTIADAENVKLNSVSVLQGGELSEALKLFGGRNADGVLKVTLMANADDSGAIINGNVNGTLTIAADGAEPISARLSGKAGTLRIVQRNTARTVMKYMPYWTEFAVEGSCPWITATLEAADLPDGLEFDPTSGRISGSPEAAGRQAYTIKANLSYADGSGSAELLYNAELSVTSNTSKNLHMSTDPDHGFFIPLGEKVDGQYYYLDPHDVEQEQNITITAECKEFEDLWLNGVKLRRTSDDYKKLNGFAMITLMPDTLSGLEYGDINTLVFAFRDNGVGELKFIAQNFIVTEDKSTIAPAAEGAEDYLNVYTPSNKYFGSVDEDTADSLSSVKIFARKGELPKGTKTVVKPSAAAKDALEMKIRIVDKHGDDVQTENGVTVQMQLPKKFRSSDVYVYTVDNGRYRTAGSIVKDDRLYFTAGGEAETYVLSDKRLSSSGVSEETANGSSRVKLIVSAAVFAASTAAFVLIVRKKSSKKK